MPRDHKQEYAHLPTSADVSVHSVMWALLGLDRQHRELHVSPACADIAEDICKALLLDVGVQVDRVVDTELATHEWFVLQTAGSPG